MQPDNFRGPHMTLPSREEQIVRTHAELIVAVVRACHDPQLAPALATPLRVSEQNGWTQLVAAIRRILKGERSPSLLRGLDDEDAAIVTAILRGLQNPATLPSLSASKGDPTLAAPGLAHLIHDAARGDAHALSYLGSLAQQMAEVSGDMARLGGIIRRLVDGERDPERLIAGMGKEGQDLVLSLLDELGKLDLH
jgi:hypothetical protein